MTKEQIIQMAREAGLIEWRPYANFKDGIWWMDEGEPDERLERFAKLVAEHEPVIDKSAAIRIATALGWTPPRQWVGLTKEERHEISMANRPYCADVMAAHEEELKRRNYG